MKTFSSFPRHQYLLKLAWPLLMSTGSISLLNLIDRIFLSWDSTLSVAAALPASSLSFAIAILLIGTTSYAGTFVAQYLGEDQKKDIGPILAQAFYVALFSFIVIPIQYQVAPYLFQPFTESISLALAQEKYFKILAWGIFPMCWSGALGGLFSGIGQTKTIMKAHLWMLAINSLLAYAWIFGVWGFPKWGLEGAAYATVCSQFVPILYYLFHSYFKAQMRSEYALMNCKLKPDLLFRFLRFGFPSGIHGCTDVATFAIFMLLCGGLSLDQLAASNIAFQIHIMGFLPALGLGMAVGIAVGQEQGSGNRISSLAYAKAGIQLSFLFAFLVALSYLFLSPWIISFFAPDHFDPNWSLIQEQAWILMCIAAILVFVDFLQIVYSSILKAAGDTAFVSIALLVASLIGLVLPSYFLVYLGGHVYHLWAVMALYLALLAVIFFVRYKQQKWLLMKVTGH